jgi:hypothetical protein
MPVTLSPNEEDNSTELDEFFHPPEHWYSMLLSQKPVIVFWEKALKALIRNITPGKIYFGKEKCFIIKNKFINPIF